ncbi:sensor histidine kinase [Flavilitoribacter nigricans]|uniref:Signal transduction histidine kinase internal region domain-containing protein n=1 Tax=Flavilitoribacter nigricans (strain ATCC 23147 / DSM 23189 / NBRC 102662 / NCIMB 1420 / SS-2) TaxID=1122177 RepID=A0A2D0N9E6_FLAN2|nr:sensor histidine kinase [Flavilitoribacter nigricans]PHN05144.1 hypothetical protein CRP01_19180 [Flavilitoribacter nigricans DSM 23189 = NBRC 102662]
MKKEVFICLVVLLIAVFQQPAFAQYDLEHPSRIIRVEDGLPNHYLRGLVQDANGFIWIGSYDGVSRFDGKRIIVYRHQPGDSLSLTHNSVISLAADPNNGEVWIGTFGGLNAFIPSTGRFRTYTHDDQDSTSLPSNYVSRLFVDRQSNLWASFRSNVLSRLDTEKDEFIQYAPEPNEDGGTESIRAIEQDALNDELIWVGTNERMFSFHRQKTTFDYNHPSFSDIQQIHSHPGGLLYIRDESGQINVYDPQAKEIVHKIAPLEGWRFGRIFQKSPEELWISCNNGIAVLRTKDHSVSYPWRDDPSEKRAYDMDLIDQQGRIWSAGAAGIKIYDPATTQFSNYIYEKTGASSPFITQRLLEDPEREVIYLNVSSGNGMYRFDRNTKEWLHIPIPEGYSGRLFYGSDLALLDDGQLLILERKGLYTLSEDGRSMVLHPVNEQLPAEESWLNLFLDSKGYVWLGGLENGVVKIDTRTWEVTALAEWLPSCRQPRFRWSFYEDQEQNIWMPVCYGMAYYSYREDAFHFLLAEENPENTFRATKDFVEGQDGILWVTDEEEGILGAINPKEPEKGIYKKYSFAQDNPTDTVRILKGNQKASLGVSKLAVDRDNNLWTISPSGMLKIHPDRRSVEIYNDLDGLQWLDEELAVPSVNQVELLSTGEIMVGFRKGMSIFDPADLRISQELPEPYLTAFNVYNNPWQSDSSLFVTHRIDLNYWENYFSFEFSSIGFTNSDHHQYQYKLDGVDEEWIYSGQRSYAAYTNVDGGNYTFLVKAANRDGIWNEDPLRIDLSVATPWWQQLWFRALVLLLILGGVYSFYQYRLRQVRNTERVRSAFENKLARVELTALRSQMNPHFIFNCLNSIESYIIRNETVKASEYLNDFSRLIRLILQNSRSNYVSVSDELEALSLYMDMENLRLRERFTYEINVDKDLDPDDIDIPPMLMQPYVENAIWHGLRHKTGSGNITIDLKKVDGFLLCAIEDNGVGRKKSAELRSRRHKKTSMGMNITQERIDIINKAYNIETSVRVIDLVSPEGDPLGTRVELSIRLR